MLCIFGYDSNHNPIEWSTSVGVGTAMVDIVEAGVNLFNLGVTAGLVVYAYWNLRFLGHGVGRRPLTALIFSAFFTVSAVAVRSVIIWTRISSL